MLARADSRSVRLVQPLLWGLAVTLVIFGVYEIVERFWLTGLEMSTLHLLHMLRGLVSALVVTVVVGWIILKTSPGFLAASPMEDAWAQQPQPTEEERTRMYVRWFIAMRWIAVLLAALLVFISVRLVGWLPAEVWWPLVGAVAVLATSNLLYTLLLRQGRGGAKLLLAQGYLDLIILTALLHFSGGIENPLSMMMLFHVIIGGILLSRRQCYGVAATASALFALMAWAEWADVAEHYTLQLFPHFLEKAGELFHPAHHSLFVASRVVLQAVVLFLTGYFVTTLAERLRDKERRLETMADRALAGQQLLEQALETTGAGLCVLNRDLQPYWANARWNGWFAGRPGPPGRASSWLNGESSPARQTLKDGQIRVTEVALENESGAGPGSCEANSQAQVFQVTTAPLRDLSGNVHRIVELAQDITQQKQTQEQMLRAGKLAAVGELAGHVAHEVNNPMAIVIAKINLLLSDYGNALPAEVAQELDKLAQLTGRVSRIAQGLLSYCRPSAARRVALDVRGPIRKSLALIEQPARALGVQIQDRLPDRVPAIRGNGNELEQVFLNLFLNALDAMPQGGELAISAIPSLERLSKGQGALDVVVEDTGLGIPDNIRERIFEPFFTTKEEGRSTGLGLSICQGLVRSHGGEIEVESEAGRGSRFTVKLPVVEAVVGKEPVHG